MVKITNILMSTIVLFLVGCGGKGGSGSHVVKMNSLSYLSPQGVNFLKVKGSNTNLISLKDTKEVAGFIQEIDSNEKDTKYLRKSQDTKVFYALKSAKILQKSIDNSYQNMQQDNTIISDVSLLSTQNFQLPYAYTIAHYSLTTYEDMQPMVLSGALVDIITKKKLKDEIKPKKDILSASEFRIMVVYGNLNGSAYYLVSVVPEDLYIENESKLSEIMNGARIAQAGIKLQKDEKHFTLKSSNKKADFLFVIDDSGSMSDNQAALSRAAQDFTNEMNTSALSFRTSIITTGNGIGSINGEACRILKKVGIIKKNNALLRSKLVAGSNGSSTETGIWNAEQALQSKSLGDSKDGVVTDLGMPAKGSSMSVIILSDEESQYPDRANKKFKPADNLFVDRNIKVYTIINTSYNSASQYDDLSIATGGIFADINHRDTSGNLNFSVIMKQIAQDAGGISSLVTLDHPAANIDKVKINGHEISYSTTNGYTYIQSSKSIVFHGIEFSKKEIKIDVKYSYYM